MSTNNEIDDYENIKCAWCGNLGTPANKIIIHVQTDGTVLGECEWCSGHEWFRRKASNGKH